jgi:putative transposase
MAFYQRRLPHWQPLGQPLFVTCRLDGSLPSHRVFPAEGLTSGQAFAAMDRLLDQACTGPRYLSQPAIARLVVEALHYGQASLQHYTLHAFVVMANHFHLLITPQVALPKLLRSLKGITAKRANQILGLTGQAFWQEESYDHWVRDGKEFDRLRAYIEQNPVKAGLVKAPEHYPWSSATKEQAGQGAGCGPGGPPHSTCSQMLAQM